VAFIPHPFSAQAWGTPGLLAKSRNPQQQRAYRPSGLLWGVSKWPHDRRHTGVGAKGARACMTGPTESRAASLVLSPEAAFSSSATHAPLLHPRQPRLTSHAALQLCGCRAAALPRGPTGATQLRTQCPQDSARLPVSSSVCRLRVHSKECSSGICESTASQSKSHQPHYHGNIQRTVSRRLSYCRARVWREGHPRDGGGHGGQVPGRERLARARQLVHRTLHYHDLPGKGEPVSRGSAARAH